MANQNLRADPTTQELVDIRTGGRTPAPNLLVAVPATLPLHDASLQPCGVAELRAWQDSVTGEEYLEYLPHSARHRDLVPIPPPPRLLPDAVPAPSAVPAAPTVTIVNDHIHTTWVPDPYGYCVGVRMNVPSINAHVILIEAFDNGVNGCVSDFHAPDNSVHFAGGTMQVGFALMDGLQRTSAYSWGPDVVIPAA